MKERAVAGANGEVLVSTRNPKTRNLVNDLPVGHPSLERLAKLDNKEKKKIVEHLLFLLFLTFIERYQLVFDTTIIIAK